MERGHRCEDTCSKATNTKAVGICAQEHVAGEVEVGVCLFFLMSVFLCLEMLHCFESREHDDRLAASAVHAYSFFPHE